MALAAGQEMRSYLDHLIAQRKTELASGGQVRDDVMDRLLQMQRVPGVGFDDTGIRNNLIGLITGWIPTVSKSTALGIDELLGVPPIWHQPARRLEPRITSMSVLQFSKRCVSRRRIQGCSVIAQPTTSWLKGRVERPPSPKVQTSLPRRSLPCMMAAYSMTLAAFVLIVLLITPCFSAGGCIPVLDNTSIAFKFP